MTNDDAPLRLPIELDTTTNGEFAPVPLGPAARLANRLARERTARAARRLGWSRRRFLGSACGAAASLLALNEAFGAAGRRGGGWSLAPETAFEPELAAAALGGDELVFDVQGHHVAPARPWRERSDFWDRTVRAFPHADCGLPDEIACFSSRQYVREVFLESDTDLAVLSFVPEPDPESAPLLIEEAAATRAAVESLAGTRRLLLHGPVHPNFPGELARMEELAERWGVSAWKTYTQYGPDGRGYWLDDERTGIPFIEKARALGIPVICVHKGFPLPGMEDRYGLCRDVGAVAKRYPDVHFIVYHSGYETATTEGPYSGSGPARGIDSLVRSLRDHEVPPGSNVYAELGSTWRFLMRDPDQAAHALGKLLRHVGEDRVLWGTDSIWYGSPQDQIQAFRSFQIAEPLREAHGYPELTPEIRARVFGLNATRPYGIDPAEAVRRARADGVQRARRAWREARAAGELPATPSPTYGPRTRRELLRLWRLRGGAP